MAVLSLSDEELLALMRAAGPLDAVFHIDS